jgi:pilus assembly protein CpaF
VRAIREQVASAIHLIVQQSRLRDGTRKITHLTEVAGMEGDKITLQDIFLFKQTGVDEQGRVTGRHEATGILPRFLNIIDAEGIQLSREIFFPRGGMRL